MVLPWKFLTIIIIVLNYLEAVYIPTGDSDASTINQCPLGCNCMGESITCPNWSPNDVPLPLPPTTIVLSLPHFQRTSINNSYFIKTPNLQWLQLNRGKLTIFPELPYLPRLSFLDVSENDIHHLPPNAFESTPHLTHLNISANNLNSASSGFLNGLSNLRVLDMSDNPKLSSLDGDFFEGRLALNYLDLSNSNINIKDISWISGLEHLYFLNLSHNSIIHPMSNMKNPVLGVLDLSYNPIKIFPSLQHIPKINELYVTHANITEISRNDLDNCKNLKILDISYNGIRQITGGTFRHCNQLQILNLSENWHLKIIGIQSFNGLSSLQFLYIDNCVSLREISNSTFAYTPLLKEIHMENTNLSVLPFSLKSLRNLTQLKIDNNRFYCSCYSHWVPHWLLTSSIINWPVNTPFSCRDKPRTLLMLEKHIEELNCERTKISPPKNQWVLAPWEESATLDCNVTGNPQPKIIWQTANHRYLLYNKSDTDPWVNKRIAYALTVTEDDTNGKYKVLPSGQIIIRNVSRNDIGRYKCFAYNSVSNASITMFLGIQDTAFRAFVMESQSFGLACAALFLFITLLVQLIRSIMERCGIECCCLRSRSQHIRQLLESVEFYKSAQLERLKDNYNSQVVSIKDGCYQQMERVRDSYSQQSQNLKDLCDYSTQQLTGARDQYVDQVNRIRDYSLGQMNRVRENYVFQRTRIRKFSTNQLFRLRETYKYQQKTFNKLLETLPDLNIQNCRTGSCQRTDSIIFDDKIDGLDMYYKIDFRDSQSSSSDYYTPNSTLTRQKNKTKDSKNHNDTSEEQNQPHARYHTRSFSLVNPISASRLTDIIKGHKRSVSQTHSTKPPSQSDSSSQTLSTPAFTPMASPRSATPVNNSFDNSPISDRQNPEQLIETSVEVVNEKPKYETSL